MPFKGSSGYDRCDCSCASDARAIAQAKPRVGETRQNTERGIYRGDSSASGTDRGCGEKPALIARHVAR
jgi:hypothetical protein